MIWIGKSRSIESVPVLISLWSRYPVPRSHLSGGSRSVVPSCECRSSIKVRFNQGCFGNVRTIPLSFHSSIALAQTSSQGILLVSMAAFIVSVEGLFMYGYIPLSDLWCGASYRDRRIVISLRCISTSVNNDHQSVKRFRSLQPFPTTLAQWMSEQYQNLCCGVSYREWRIVVSE